MPKKIIILTTGQPSTNPRMVKEYTALKKAGYHVKVYYSYWDSWAEASDKDFFSGVDIDKNDFVLVGGSPTRRKLTYQTTRIFQKINLFIYKTTGWNKVAAFSRTSSSLINAAMHEQADLYIAHNAGALPAAVAGALTYKSKAGFDAEDFHRGEHKNQQSVGCRLLIEIEDKYLHQCSYITAASTLIAQEYKNVYPNLSFVTINNVFSKKYLQHYSPVNSHQISFFWFSQTIGPYRGLENVVIALNKVCNNYNITLSLMGNVTENFKNELQSLATNFKIEFLQPVPPDVVFQVASKFDIGLSTEVPDFLNRDICLTNKIFTYLLSGNCILFSSTRAQIQFYKAHPQTGFIFELGNVDKIVELIADLCAHTQKIDDAKKGSLSLAEADLNWESESQKFLQIIKEVIS